MGVRQTCGMNTPTTPRLTPHEERVVSVRAGCDPRTVRAYLRGAAQRSTVAARISDALRALGFVEPPSDVPVIQRRSAR